MRDPFDYALSGLRSVGENRFRIFGQCYIFATSSRSRRNTCVLEVWPGPSRHGPESLEGLVTGVFFLWWPLLSMNMLQINVSKLLEFLQASNRQLLHLFSQS
jgi:hypothetical protein